MAATYGVQFRPSAAERWTTCTASVKACANVPVAPSTSYADEGTAAHWVFEQAGAAGRSAFDWVGAEAPVGGEQFIEVSEDMAEAVNKALDYVQRVMQAERVLYLEREVRCSVELNARPMAGTSDLLLLTESGHVHVMDYKHGKGVRVDAHRNPQLSLYALGAVQALAGLGVTITGVSLHILQPRIGNFSVDRFDLAELQARAVSYQRAMLEALGSEPQFRPSNAACRWCPLKATCRARATKHYATVAPAFELGNRQLEQADVTAPEQLTDAQASLVLYDVPMIRDWCNSIEEHVRELVKQGRVVGWKLVAGRNMRHWASEEAAVAAMEEAGLARGSYIEESIISPAKAEKATGKATYTEKLAPVVETKQGKPALVPASDPRPALLADEFNLPGEQQ